MELHTAIQITPPATPDDRPADADPLLRPAPLLPPRGPLPDMLTPDRAGLLARLRQIQAVMAATLQQEVRDGD